MEEDEKIDYKLHLHKQLDNLVEMGISVYDLAVVNKQAIRSNYILKDKIKEKIEELVEQGDYRTAENPNGRVHFYKEPVDYQLEILKELLEGK